MMGVERIAMNDKKQNLISVLNAICSNSIKRVYNTKWGLMYNSPIDYLTGKPDIHGNPIDYMISQKEKEKQPDYYKYGCPSFVSEYSIDSEIKKPNEFKDKIDEHLIFDSIFIDFDADESKGITPETAINQAIKTAKYLRDKFNIECLVNASGSKGGHIHILFNPIELKHPKEVKILFTERLEKGLRVTADSKVKNSIKRLMRIPCSKHNKTGKYGHFIDIDDNESITDALIGNAYNSPFELIEKGTKYYIPDLPDLDKNTESIKPILEHLDELSETNIKNIDTKNYYIEPEIIDSDDEFMHRFSKLYYEGNRWNIGHALIFMFKR